MIDLFLQLHPVMQAFMATLFTWAVTAAGAAIVFFSRAVNDKLMDSMLGFAAGVMIAASFWSLLAPGIEMAEQFGQTPVLPEFVAGEVSPQVSRFLLHQFPGFRPRFPIRLPGFPVNVRLH